MSETTDKSLTRKHLREVIAGLDPQQRHDKSLAACALVAATPEFAAARVVMLYLSMPLELDTAPLALRCWQDDKTVVVPKVSWDQKRMMPVEITSLTTDIAVTGPGVREPVSGNPIPLDLVDLVIVPGLGFSRTGHRIGRGMGFYDRFLAQDDFNGVSCGLCFEEQLLDTLPIQPHDIPLGMIATDRSLRRFASHAIPQHTH